MYLPCGCVGMYTGIPCGGLGNVPCVDVPCVDVPFGRWLCHVVGIYRVAGGGGCSVCRVGFLGEGGRIFLNALKLY